MASLRGIDRLELYTGTSQKGMQRAAREELHVTA